MRLAPLQKWMQAVVTASTDIDQGLRAPAARRVAPPDAVDRVLLPSRTMTGPERLAVYSEMYPLRMRDALASDYPGLAAFLGDDFMSLVTAYAERHPSASYTLNRFGDHVPAYLAKQRRFSPGAFLADLARLELAITEAFDAPETTPLEPDALRRITPERLGRSTFEFCPAVRLVALDWNAASWLDAFRSGARHRPRPRRVPGHEVVVRRRYSVYRFSASAAAFAVLLDLKAGMTLDATVARALSRRGRRACRAEDLGGWFERWTAEGVFSRIRRPRP